MVKEKFFGNWKNFRNISLGLVASLFLSWLIFNTFAFVPDGQEDKWLLIFLSYSTFMGITFGSADARSKLYNTNFFKSIPRFLLFFIPAFFVLYFLLQLVEPAYSGSSVIEILRNIPVWLAIINAFVFATFESSVWQGLLDYRMGRIASPISAGIFHMFIWSGGVFMIIPVVTFLFMGFSWFNWYFRKDKNDLIPAIAIHTAYNFLILGIILKPF